MPLAVQLANIGAEAERAISWKEKQQSEYANKSFERTMQMLELTIADSKNLSRLKELTRLKEIWVDYLAGENQYRTGSRFWAEYFGPYYFAARRGV